MKRGHALRPQDILVLLKIHIMNGARWRQIDLASALGLSQAEVANSLARSQFAKLLTSGNRPIRVALEEFIIHGLKYVFPAKPGEMTRGVPTAHSAKPLARHFQSNTKYVWPWAFGKVRGESIEPLFKSVPEIVGHDQKLYEYLALIDSVRIGKAREIQLACKELKKRMS